jgi:hypothetical protein
VFCKVLYKRHAVQGLEILSQIVPQLNSVILSSNNFSGVNALKSLALAIDMEENRNLNHIDLR